MSSRSRVGCRLGPAQATDGFSFTFQGLYPELHDGLLLQWTRHIVAKSAGTHTGHAFRDTWGTPARASMDRKSGIQDLTYLYSTVLVIEFDVDPLWLAEWRLALYSESVALMLQK